MRRPPRGAPLLVEERDIGGLRAALHRGDVGVDVGEVLVAHVLRVVARHGLARAAHLLREALVGPDVVGDARARGAVAALARGAVARVAHVVHVERLAARDVARGCVGEGGERERGERGGHQLLHVSSSCCSAIAAAASRWFAKRRSANDTKPPARRKAPFAQNTARSPAAEPSPPKTNGTAICVSLFTVRRMPSASPERPAGAWLYVRRIVSGCAQPRPMPRKKAVNARSGARSTSGTRRYVAPALNR